MMIALWALFMYPLSVNMMTSAPEIRVIHTIVRISPKSNRKFAFLSTSGLARPKSMAKKITDSKKIAATRKLNNIFSPPFLKQNGNKSRHDDDNKNQFSPPFEDAPCERDDSRKEHTEDKSSDKSNDSRNYSERTECIADDKANDDAKDHPNDPNPFYTCQCASSTIKNTSRRNCYQNGCN